MLDFLNIVNAKQESIQGASPFGLLYRYVVPLCINKESFIVSRLFEEKRGDIVFGFPSFRQSFRPPSSSRYFVDATPPTVLL